MVGPSIIFYIFFAIPYIFLMYWLVKQDKKKYAWGLAIVTIIAIVGIIVSQKASKVAIENYKQHQIDAREIERENQQDSLNNQ
jgi:pilus assembly protein TadC